MTRLRVLPAVMATLFGPALGGCNETASEDPGASSTRRLADEVAAVEAEATGMASAAPAGTPAPEAPEELPREALEGLGYLGSGEVQQGGNEVRGAVRSRARRTSALVQAAARPTPEPEPADREGYARIDASPFIDTRQDPRSTFSVDVDTASYANVRRFLLGERRRPPADAVRLEEMVNYFRYASGQAPPREHPVAVDVEVRACPWNTDHELLRVGLRTAPLGLDGGPPRNLTFLLDVSGSMGSPDKLPLLKRSLALLTHDLREQDRVAMVVYAGASGLVLPPTSGSERGTILAALDRLQAGGSTAGAAGLELAYRTAREGFQRGGINRVILATDGDFNVGPSSEGELTRLIEEHRRSGVFLTVLGFGRGNLQDARMEALADRGNGNYAYVDSLAEARKVLVREAGGTLVTVAQDVKLQLEMNPARVARHRLLGYENRRLAHRDFRDDTKDAGEMGAGHEVTAFYEIVPVGAPDAASGDDVPGLRYQEDAPAPGPDPSGGSELAFVRVRYQPPGGGEGRELSVPVASPSAEALAMPGSEAFRFGAAVAGFALALREDPVARPSLSALRTLAAGAVGDDPHGERRELLRMIDVARD
ncbi:MAG: VWA domain-containing protein [Myxococcota bacterium]